MKPLPRGRFVPKRSRANEPAYSTPESAVAKFCGTRIRTGRRPDHRARARRIQGSSEVTVRFRSPQTDRNRFGLRPKENNPGSCRNIHLRCATLFPTILDGRVDGELDLAWSPDKGD